AWRRLHTPGRPARDARHLDCGRRYRHFRYNEARSRFAGESMLSVYVPQGTSLVRQPVRSDEPVPDNAVWIDLVQPTMAEDKLTQRALGIAVPTREEMQEIEVTSRLYLENGARYMTATLMCQSDTETPKTTAVTFILSGHRLVTVRYDEPRPFAIVGNRLGRSSSPAVTGEPVLMGSLDANNHPCADLLQKIGPAVGPRTRSI